MSAKPEEQFSLHSIEAEDTDEAWEIAEGEIATNNSQEWLLTENELSALKLVLQKGV
jgi:hypothetical protein